MKQIKLPQTVLICPEVDSRDTARTNDHIYRENVKNIIFVASRIENFLAAGITKYFYGEDAKKRTVLDNMIVSTDFFTFSAKRKTFLAIIVEGQKYSPPLGQKCSPGWIKSIPHPF